MLYTTNLMLKKPGGLEMVGPHDFNYNFDIIDDEVNKIKSMGKVVEVSANKTLGLSDSNTVQICDSASNITITVPADSVTFDIGAEIAIIRYNTGNVTIAPASGVTIKSTDNKLSIDKTGAGGTLKKIRSNEWLLIGSLA